MNRISDNWPPHREAEIATVPLVLAHEPPFFIGSLQIEPALRRVVRDDGADTIVEPLVMQVLVALGRANGDILTRDELVDRCWDGRIVGDDSIARVIALLRKLAAGFGAGAFTVETIAKVGYRLLVAEAEAGAQESESMQPPRGIGGRMTALIGAACLLAAGGAASAYLVPDRAPAPLSVGVEAAMGPRDDTATRRFASALTSDLTRFAGAVSRINLIDDGTAGDGARPDLLVRVALDPTGSSPSAVARLVRGDDGSILWSERFVAEDRDEGHLRRNVALGVARIVRCGLERAAAVSDDAASVRLYFAACGAMEAGDWAAALSHVSQAVARQPEDAAGWACLAMATLLSDRGWSGAMTASAETRRIAKAHARKALSLDPHSGRAYQALAIAAGPFGSEGMTILASGIRADPDHDSLHGLRSLVLLNSGYVKASLAPSQRAMGLDPTNIDAHFLSAHLLMAAGRSDEALALQAKIEEVFPGEQQTVQLRHQFLLNGPDPARALAEFELLEVRPENHPFALRLLEAQLRKRAGLPLPEQGAFDRDAEAAFRDDPSLAWQIAAVLADLGQTERAFAWIARGPRADPLRRWWPLFLPHAAPLRRDPRFFAAMNELGLVEIWRKRGQWPDFCSEPGLRYDCRREAARLMRKPAVA